MNFFGEKFNFGLYITKKIVNFGNNGNCDTVTSYKGCLYFLACIIVANKHTYLRCLFFQLQRCCNTPLLPGPPLTLNYAWSKIETCSNFSENSVKLFVFFKDSKNVQFEASPMIRFKLQKIIGQGSFQILCRGQNLKLLQF